MTEPNIPEYMIDNKLRVDIVVGAVSPINNQVIK